MTNQPSQRLFKIASEINIGKEAIVEFLKSKGFEIENKPSANLTPEMVELVFDKFKREKKAAEKQREKIEKHKVLRKPGPEKAPEFKDTVTKPAHEPEPLPHVPVKEPEPEPKLVQPPVKEPEIVQQAEAPADVLPEPVKDTTPQVGQIIDIGQKKPSRFGKSKEKDQKQHEDAIAAKAAPKAEPEADKLKDKKDFKPKKKETKPEEKVTGVPESKVAAEIPAAANVVPVETSADKEQTAQAESAHEEDAAVQEGEVSARRKKKRKPMVEFEVELGHAPKLKGLTIVGKIDLQAARKKKEKAKLPIKPEEGEEFEEDADKTKGKLIKIKKKGKGKGLEKLEEVEKVGFEDKKKKKRKKSIRELISQEDIDRAIRKTLSGMEDHSFQAARSRLKQKKKLEREEKELKIAEEKQKEEGILRLTEFVTTGDLANLIGVSANDIILKCMQLGLMVTINQRLDKDTITVIADDYDLAVEFVDQDAIIKLDDFEEDDEEDLLPRPPIVTIMGHVDHGKTSLLDYIRHSNVVAGEAGGITQHIGAYRVNLPGNKSITFLDTPGHEAFTAMRARGAQVTDIVVLVVAADDSVMPQTIEAISHAMAAEVPIVVAINKIDKPDARPDRIKQQLADQKILVEDWGGKYQSVEISAKQGLNVDLLLEKILLEAELLELSANPDRKAKGTVIESHMSKGLGNVATVIVQKGTLKVGDPFVAGVHHGRVRAMLDERGNRVEIAGPSTPVGVIGFDGLPEAGDILNVIDSDTEARSIATQRQQFKREQELRSVRQITLDDISKQIQLGGVKDLKLIIKGDVGGSVEALSDSLLKLSRDEVRVVILHKGVGTISESDVMLAVASGAVIIGFQVPVSIKARKLADSEAVDIRQYNIIYDCINEIQLALEGLLSPEIKEEILGVVEIRRVFKISKTGNIAGCYVQNGKISRNDKIRLLREGLPIFTGSIHSLKRNKDDVREVEQGYECGIMISNFNDVEEGDIIEAYKMVEIKRHLS